MQIFIDGDACPVLDIVENLAEEYHLNLCVICDTNHFLQLDYGELIIVDQCSDKTDFVLLNKVQINDIVVTQDYGLAAMVLAKKAKVISPTGKVYTDDNIEELLFSRYVAKKIRNSSKKTHLKGPKKRTKDDDDYFRIQLKSMILSKNRN